MSVLSRWKAKLKARRAELAAAKKVVTEKTASVTRAEKVVARHAHDDDVVVSKSGWHPDAKRVVYADAGAFTGGNPKLVWHTTEGSSLPRYSGSAPHFTLNPKTGELWQHVPVNRSARSLEHPAGTVETNRAHAIQVELIGFAKDSGSWPDSSYARIAKLARWIEANTGVPRKCSVTFSNTPKRLTDSAWLGYSGHLGHQHVPNNHHWDPGKLDIKKVLA